MANPILEAMQNVSSSQPTTQATNPMSLVQAIQHSNNPSAMIQQLAQNNPNVANALNLVRQYGGNPQTAFYEEAKRRGIDPNQILGMLR